MKELVLRDRNHPSVIFWSFCNEVGCGNGATQPTYDFKAVTYEADGSRAVSANMCDGWGTCTYDSPITALVNMSVQLDVQGFSHVQDFVFENFKLLAPDKPLAATECCSCETQRGEDADLPLAPGVFFNNFNAECVAEQTNWSNLLSYVTGQFVWTMVSAAIQWHPCQAERARSVPFCRFCPTALLVCMQFDYFGEPQTWPMISSAFGSYDLSGERALLSLSRALASPAMNCSPATSPPLLRLQASRRRLSGGTGRGGWQTSPPRTPAARPCLPPTPARLCTSWRAGRTAQMARAPSTS